MSNSLTVSIVLYGVIDPKQEQTWSEWYRFSTDLADSLGCPVNYLGVSGQSFKSGKILKRKGAEKRLLNELNAGGGVESIELYSLPGNFQTAAFDFQLYMTREYRSKESYILFTVKSEFFPLERCDSIVNILKDFIGFTNGQIFEMAIDETPQFYAAKVNSLDAFSTLRVVRELN